MASIDRSFLGTGWSFPPTFRREWWGPEMLTGEEDVEAAFILFSLRLQVKE
jgi:hypothetical protein